MKTKRRHDLQTNALADWLGKQIVLIKPYSKGILGVVIVLSAVLLWRSIANSNAKRHATTTWEAYFLAEGKGSADDLETMADNHPKSVAAIWARHDAAEVCLLQGEHFLFTNRADAKSKLEQAINLLNTVITASEGKDELDLLTRKASLQLAYATECLAGKLSEARQLYSQVIENWPDTPTASRAQERLDYLNTATATEFYPDFFAANPVTTPPPSGPSDTSPTLPGLDGPSFTLPSIEDLPEPGAVAPGPDSPFNPLTTPPSGEPVPRDPLLDSPYEPSETEGDDPAAPDTTETEGGDDAPEGGDNDSSTTETDSPESAPESTEPSEEPTTPAADLPEAPESQGTESPSTDEEGPSLGLPDAE